MEIELLKEKVLEGCRISKEEAQALYAQGGDTLFAAADEIRRTMCGNGFDLCSIVNGKCGRCSEDCRYCAQSAYYPADVGEYPLLPEEQFRAEAIKNNALGIGRFSIVTSGKRLTEEEIGKVCEIYRQLSKTGVHLCASHGLLQEKDFIRLKKAGVSRYHNNLETSRRNFPNICTTHTYDDKLNTIRAAQRAGLLVCSGGIIGMGETPEDRIDMALELRELGVVSVPINILNPIPHTPFESFPVLDEEEIRRTAAVYRFILPRAVIRLAGGRGLLKDKGKSVFQSGANGAITGDMLTTAGVDARDDHKMIKDLGMEAKCI